jgi:hypothetical protein
MGVVGAVADDQEAEYIRNVCENDVVTGENLLAALRYVSALFLKSISVLSFHTRIGLQVTYFVSLLLIFCMNVSPISTR